MKTLLLFALATAVVATPLTWKKTTPYATLSLTLPASVSHVPVLADRLYRGEIKQLQRFAASAADPKDGLPSQGPVFRRLGRWDMEVTYAAGVETPRLISVTRLAFEDSHGAHPSHFNGGVLFDKTTNANLHPLDLLRPGADRARLDKALCDAARAAKRERMSDWNEKEDSNFTCPTWRGVPGPDGKMFQGTNPPQIALAPSDVAGRAGGLVFLYSPYDLGAYAEGDYELALPAAVLKDALKPEYAGEFGGKLRLLKRPG